MSYCRFGSDSSVYVYAGSYELDERELMYWDCCGCSLTDNFKADNPSEMITHLMRHREAGHMVPDYAIERLQWEAERMTGKQVTAAQWDENLFPTDVIEALDRLAWES